LDVDMDNMCYVNTSDNVTLFVPHFSGGALVNDTFPPEINITNPENNSEINNSYFDFGLIVKELNPEGGYCNYTLSNVSGELISEELTIDDLLWASGAEYYFEKHLNNITNGNYSLKIFCVDSKNQGSEKTHNFTVEDTVSPTISNITVSKTTSSATISWITNEYSNSLINYTGGIINSTSFVKEHSLELTGLNADTTYSYNIASCDLNNQCVVNMDNNFTTNSESSDDGGGSSGGSSGGIVGGEVTEEESFWNLTINISQDNFFKGYSNKIGKGERFKVDINGEEHHIGVVNIDVKKEKVTINISSDTQQTVLSLGDTKKFDVNNDNYYDISVELLGIQDNKANLNIKSIYEEIPSEEQEEQEKNETKEEDVSEEDKDKNYLWIWIVAIVIIIAGIGFYLFKKRKDFFKNNKKTRFWKKKSS